MTDYDRYTIRFADLGGDTAVPDLTIEASGADPLAQQVLRFAGNRHPGRDLSVTVEDMRRGRVFAGSKVAGHFTITPAEAAAPPSNNLTPTAAQDNWEPAYSPWRHGGWYVNNIHYPSGAVGCVSRNFPDRKWRIVCDDRPNAHEKYTYANRDAAAQAERELARARWQRIAQLAAGLAPAGQLGTSPNDSDAPCTACGMVVYAEQGVVVPGTSMPAAVLDSSCAKAIAREQADPGGARVAPAGYARNTGQAHQGLPQALAAECFPPTPAAGLPPENGAATSSGPPGRGTSRRQPGRSPRATRRR
jgi:hypothetical protein